MVLDAKDYALPQQRKRAWSVLIHAKSFNIARKEAARFCLEVLDKADSLKVQSGSESDEFCGGASARATS